MRGNSLFLRTVYEKGTSLVWSPTLLFQEALLHTQLLFVQYRGKMISLLYYVLFSCTFSDVNSSSVVDINFHYSFPHIIIASALYWLRCQPAELLPCFCMQCACRLWKQQTHPHHEKCLHQSCIFIHVCLINTLAFENLGKLKFASLFTVAIYNSH